MLKLADVFVLVSSFGWLAGAWLVCAQGLDPIELLQHSKRQAHLVSSGLSLDASAPENAVL